MDQGCTVPIKAKVSEAIASYVSMLPSSRGLSPQGIIAMADAFTQLPELRHLTITELRTFLALAFRRQAYGKLYGGFGFDTLMEWFHTYLEDRQLAIVTYREAEHATRTAMEKGRRERHDGDAWGGGEIGDIWSNQHREDVP